MVKLSSPLVIANRDAGGAGAVLGGERLPKPVSRFFRGATSERSYWILLLGNYGALFVGSVASSLLTRFYFIHGGSSRWVTTLVQSAGFPLLLIPICISSCNGRRTRDTADGGRPSRPFSSFTRHMLGLCTVIGMFMGLNNFLFSWGISYLSVSTSSLLLSSQLAFNLVLSVLLVRQRLTFPILNCVVLLTVSSMLLGLGGSGDRPAGVTRWQFFAGFFSILGASVLFALYLPVMEIVYRQVDSYRTAMEMQVIMEASATLFSVVGMTTGGSLGDLTREGASVFDHGQRAYWTTIAATVACWQLCFMGTAGMVFLTTSLNGGICMTALLSMNVVGGVVVLGDTFGGEKAVSTALCLWAFGSYLYAEYCRKKEQGGVHCEKQAVTAEEGNNSDDVVATDAGV